MIHYSLIVSVFAAFAWCAQTKLCMPFLMVVRIDIKPTLKLLNRFRNNATINPDKGTYYPIGIMQPYTISLKIK